MTATTTRPARLWARLAALAVLLAAVAIPTGEAAGGHEFPDVAGDHPFHQQTGWMASQGLTSGYDDGTFRPATPVTRQAMAVFLHGLADQPQGPHPDPGFDDVDDGHPFYEQIAWAAQAGIVDGYPDNTFRPGAVVTRQAAVAFLHRAEGAPQGPDPDPGFGDVEPGHTFYDEIAWAADEGITAGYGDNTFRPATGMARQAAAAFLFVADGQDLDRVARLVVTFCDVGQADASVVAAGDVTMLVDAGHWQRSDVSGCLDGAGVDDLDVLAFTHPDADHIGQAVDVLDSYDVDEVWRTSDANDSNTYRDYDQRLSHGEAAGEFDVVYPRAGDRLEVGGVDVDVVHPADSDDSDLSLRVGATVSGYGEASVLFTGDAEGAAENYMVTSNAAWLEADIYQVGHHGSDTSSSPGLIDAGNFTYAVWSADENNPYGHPHDGPLRRLVEAGVEVYGTATHGTVTATAGPAGWAISTQTGAPPHDGNGEDTPEGCDPGQVDINSADHDRLQEIIHIGPDRADHIIGLRRDQPFSDLDDLERVDGLGPSRIQDIKDQRLACAGS